jgi:NADPH:quinone reductase-like Zn-dependent oxidoreductase
MRQIWITRAGAPETLVVMEAPDPVAAAGQVRIRVKAAGINFADIMARLGIYPDAPPLPTVVGYEVAGVVDQVGSGVTSLKTGQEVVALCRFGGYSDVICVPQIQAFPLPPNLTPAQGAAIPVNYLTAYQMLHSMGSLKAGDKVLVHSAAGGVGFAAIDLCKIAGAEVIGTASRSKHETLLARGARHAIDYRTADFETEVMRITGGKGVQIVLDPVGGDSWAKGLRCLAPTGRLVVFGFSAAATGKVRSLFAGIKNFLAIPWFKCNPLYLMNANKAIVGVNLGHMWNETELLKIWMNQLLTWCVDGKIHPTVDKEFRFTEAAQAHHYIQDRKNMGKVVLVP